MPKVSADQWNAMSATQRKAANQAQGGKGGSNTPAAPAGPTKDPATIAANAAAQANAQVNNQNYQDASDYAHKTTGATNFNGTNDYLSDVGDKASAASFDEPLDYLRQFLGGNTTGSGNGSYPGVSQSSYQSGVAADRARAAGGGGGGNVPDTVGGSDSFFAQHMRDLFDPSRLDPNSDPTMQPYLQAMEDQSNRAFAQNKALLDAQSEGSGRFGGGMYQNMQGLAAGENSRALQQQLAQTLFGARQNALDAQMQGLGLTNQRDLGAMQDATQRYGIDTQAAMSGAGNALAAQQAASAQRLQAINMLMGQQQFGLGMEQQVGQNLMQNQLGSMNAMPGIENANQGYMGIQNQSAGILQQPRLAQIGNAPAMANLRWQQQMYNSPEGQMQRYLSMIGDVAGLGGSQWGQGPPPTMQPLGPGPLGAGIMGGLGGYAVGAGMNGGH